MFFVQYALESAQVVGLMILASGLLGRNLVLRRDLTVREARAVRMLDLYAWFGAAIVGVSHLGVALPDIGSPRPEGVAASGVPELVPPGRSRDARLLGRRARPGRQERPTPPHAVPASLTWSADT